MEENTGLEGYFGQKNNRSKSNLNNVATFNFVESIN